MVWNNIDCFAIKNRLLSKNTLRFIHLGYPLLRVRANINFYKDSGDFCLLKKHILQLVGSDTRNPTAYVKDRLEVFRLLGLDNELYDVANYYYEQLILEGKLHDTPQGVLAGPAPAGDPAYARIRSAREIGTHLTIDPFGAVICGKNVSELRCLSTTEIRESMARDIYLPPLPAYVYQPDRLESEINHRNFDFSRCTEESRNEQLKQQNMPPATQGIQLVKDGDAPVVEVYWLPCYVALEKTANGTVFALYRQGDGKAIGDQCPANDPGRKVLFAINDPVHKELKKFLIQLFKTQCSSDLRYKLTETLSVPIKESKGDLADKVAVDNYGNYRVSLSSEQLDRLAQATGKELQDALTVLLEGFGLVGTREAGRLVRFSLTADQKATCETLLQQLHLKAAE